MGKRKERRFAANNTSRRVKLDLFAEPPSGDLGGSDVRCDGVEKEQTETNELPSSSGQKTENPLLLLGQYSDEEVEEEKEDKADDATADSSLANKNEQVDGHKDTNIKSGAYTTMQMVNQQQTAEVSSATYFKAEGGSGYVAASNSTAFDGLNKQTDPSVQASGTVSLEQYASPMDVTSQWKMILHEESNQYYYWNTLTGGTSWEVPAVLTQTATAYGSGYNDSGHMVTDAYTLSSGAEPSYLQQPVENMYTGSSTSLTAELGERNKSENHYAKSLGTDVHQVECQIDSAVNYQPCQEEELAAPGVSDHVQATVDQGAATDLPSRLLSQSEGLLEKLRSLKRSHGNFHSNEQISKYILELEVRHSDVKALLNETSPLLSFWLHTEKELKRLEDGVNDEIYELAKSAVMDGIAETDKSSPKQKPVIDETQDSVEEGELAQSLHSEESADASGDGSPTHSPQSNPAQHSDNVTTLDEIQKAGSPVVEDVDMDVDMEVEESLPLSPAQTIDASNGKLLSQTEPSNLHEDVPPPPGEEWVPPPPSEIEDVPPPPPDSFSEPAPPPPSSENDHVLPSLSTDSVGVPYTVPQSYIQQPADYAAQYSLSYPESSYQYIAAPNTQFYGHVDGSQASLPQSAYYYETVPGASEVAPAEAYYNLNGVAPLFPVSAETTLSHGGVGSANYNIPSDSSKAVEPSSKSNDSAETASLSTAAQSTDGTGGSSLLKGPSKVKRPKKRTVATTTSTLRSNKKVSSLVDKWKAAKEELNDSEEEEEEDDYGVLDKKRRREIEEWKSRQIASGGAKDNANFQPLGGDWREKVKRRKEQAGREGDEPKKKEDKQQKPDLAKLSAHLPSGWQAYWDESTKKAYYGNTITSETSWTRPTTNT